MKAVTILQSLLRDYHPAQLRRPFVGRDPVTGRRSTRLVSNCAAGVAGRSTPPSDMEQLPEYGLWVNHVIV